MDAVFGQNYGHDKPGPEKRTRMPSAPVCDSDDNLAVQKALGILKLIWFDMGSVPESIQLAVVEYFKLQHEEVFHGLSKNALSWVRFRVFYL